MVSISDLRLATSVLLLVVATVVVSHAAEKEKARVWTDITGKHKTEAEFVSADDEQVTLRKPGTKKTLTMKLSRLSEADREYVQQRRDAIEAEEANDASTGSAESESASEPSRKPAKPTPPPASTQPNVANSVRNAVYRAESRDKMRQIAIALVSFATERDKFPQSTALASSDGKSGLSWRVAILPMLDENALYQQFRLQEPWDSEHNQKLVARMPKIFQSPGSALDRGYTNYLGVAGPNTILNTAKRPTKVASITDGTSKTAMIVEVDDTNGTWIFLTDCRSML